MRLIITFSIGLVITSFGQEMKLSPVEIRNQINLMQDQSIFSDSLEYVDSNCTYLNKGLPYSGYVIHFFDHQYRFNLFEKGKYFGEEWIFDATSAPLNSDSLVAHLREFRVRCDTNAYFMIVTTYYDFLKDKVHEIFIDHRYECASREPEVEAFDVIFGGDDYSELAYRSFYENGNKKEVSEGHPFKDGKRIEYYEYGRKSSYSKVKKNGQNGLIKEFDTDGKCTKRLKFRNNKIRGFYVILGDKFTLSFIARHQLKKKNKRKKED